MRASFYRVLKKMGGYIRIQNHKENNPALLIFKFFGGSIQTICTFPVFVFRDGFIQFLNQNSIESLIHYPIPPHRQRALADFSHLKLPLTEQIHKRIISLPISSILINEMQTVIDFVNTH